MSVQEAVNGLTMRGVVCILVGIFMVTKMIVAVFHPLANFMAVVQLIVAPSVWMRVMREME
jgi:hypothetical protein